MNAKERRRHARAIREGVRAEILSAKLIGDINNEESAVLLRSLTLNHGVLNAQRELQLALVQKSRRGKSQIQGSSLYAAMMDRAYFDAMMDRAYFDAMKGNIK